MQTADLENWFRIQFERELWRKLYVSLARRFSEACADQGESSLSIRERDVFARARTLEAEAATFADGVDFSALIDEAVRHVENDVEIQRQTRMTERRGLRH